MNFRFNRLWLLSLFMFPVILWKLPSTYFDKTGFDLCPSKAFFNIECYGCGLTRAVLHMHHFDYLEAIYYNYSVVLIYPLLIFFWFRLVIGGIRRELVWQKSMN
jgi:hypothetical protein